MRERHKILRHKNSELPAEVSWISMSPLKILFMKESTEGVAEGQTTAEAGKQEIEENVGQESVRKTV